MIPETLQQQSPDFSNFTKVLSLFLRNFCSGDKATRTFYYVTINGNNFECYRSEPLENLLLYSSKFFLDKNQFRSLNLIFKILLSAFFLSYKYDFIFIFMTRSL